MMVDQIRYLLKDLKVYSIVSHSSLHKTAHEMASWSKNIHSQLGWQRGLKCLPTAERGGHSKYNGKSVRNTKEKGKHLSLFPSQPSQGDFPYWSLNIWQTNMDKTKKPKVSTNDHSEVKACTPSEHVITRRCPLWALSYCLQASLQGTATPPAEEQKNSQMLDNVSLMLGSDIHSFIHSINHFL